MEGIWPYKLSEAKPFHMGYLSGFQAERRDMESSEFQGELLNDVNKYGKKLLRGERQRLRFRDNEEVRLYH